MDRRYQKLLLKELYRHYPYYTQKWIDSLFNLYADILPDEQEQKRNMAYLKEKHFVEDNPPHSGNLRITAEGIEYLEKLEEQLVEQKE